MFRPGEVIPETAPYLVRHFRHRPDHVVTAVVGALFPECHQCKAAVQFTQLDSSVFRSGVRIDSDPDFAPEASLSASV